MIFETPIYNFTKDFPLMWEEIPIGLPLDADCDTVEEVALGAARAHAEPTRMPDAAPLDRIKGLVHVGRVHFTLHVGGIEATLRFVVLAHSGRETKDAVTRELLEGLRVRDVNLRV